MPRPADLAVLLHTRRDEWLLAWRRKARRTEAGRSLDLSTLNDHVPVIIDSVLDSLARCESPEPEPSVLRGAPTHGARRLHDGYEMGDVVGELSVLRATAIDLAEANGMVLEGTTLWALNDAFDRVIADAVQAYAQAMNEALQRQQSAHLAFVAHDLRTPLGAIALAVQALSRAMPAGDLNPIVPRMLDSLVRNVGHLTHMLDDMLDLSAASGAGTTPARPCQVALWPLVDGLAQGLQTQADAAGTRITVEVPDTLHVRADAALLGRALQNLLINAIEYASPGVVTVRAERRGDEVRCEVRDHGRGIGPERLARLFDAQPDGRQGNGHHGLGLSIASRFIEAQDGRIAVRSGADGTTFEIDLPAGDAPEPG